MTIDDKTSEKNAVTKGEAKTHKRGPSFTSKDTENKEGKKANAK